MRKISVLLMIFVLIQCMMYSVFAETKEELNNKKSDIDKKINQTNSEIKDVQSKKDSALNKINELTESISEYEIEINLLKENIESLNSQISEKEIEIKEKEEKYNESQELLNKRLIALYEAGSTSYLDMLLSSESLSDFISKYYLISELAEYDEELLSKIENDKEEINREKNSLEESKITLENNKNDLQVKQNSLNSSLSEKNSLYTELTDEEKTLQKQLEEYEQDKKEIVEEISKLSSNVTTTVTPSECGYISPLSGKTKANITTGFGKYSWGGKHTGSDFAVAGGTEVHAVKDGKVIISTALRDSSGNYKSYG